MKVKKQDVITQLEYMLREHQRELTQLLNTKDRSSAEYGQRVHDLLLSITLLKDDIIRCQAVVIAELNLRKRFKRSA